MRKISLLIGIVSISLIAAACSNAMDHEQMGHPTGNQNPKATENRLTLQTKNVTRVNQDDPILAAVETSQMVWPATDDGNRPNTVLLGLTGDWKVNMPAVKMVHHPNNGPLLYAQKDSIPTATLQELKRLSPKGSDQNQGIQVILIGDFSEKVRTTLEKEGFKVDQIKGKDPAVMAKDVDSYYAKASGNQYPNSIIIGSLDSPEYTMPAANWIAHMPEPLLYVTKDAIPEATKQALQTRGNKANIYVLGPDNIISSEVEKQLATYGKVTRISGKTPEENAIAFAKFKDQATGFGWGVTKPGHGLTFVRTNQLDSAISSAPFAHLGKHAPMLVLSSSELTPAMHEYLGSLQPKFQKEPTEGPYNHAFVIGTEKSIPFTVQGMIDQMLEIVSATGQDHGSHGNTNSESAPPKTEAPTSPHSGH